ncbi:MAG: prolyl oligopeptidase family serine peptidase [Verrucomicrobia bacterium]|nr:prolyl oligopeptidase family serine peptidase [Verrucomicrobiota bacterium]MBI3867041.1 prolyl oligopeptidase family serine peptidase [Verrucomicrobiota bacterium]
MGQQLQTGYQRASYISPLDDSAQPFALWVPRDYSPRRQYPLIVALHGMDGDERMIPEQCFDIPERGFSNEVILLSVFGRGDIAFEGPGEADFWDAIQWVRDRYRINPSRQYLTGLSMGGYATWRFAVEHPEQWAAIAPVCGGGDVNALSALREVPVWCVHGEMDEFVSVNESRRLIEELRRLRFPHRYDELEGWGHNSWDWLYDPDRHKDTLVDWFLRHRKEHPAPVVRRPRRVGGFKDLFQERVIISHPARTPIPGEADLLRAEAERIARYSFGDFLMKTGKLLVRPDTEISPDELANANHLMIGRNDNHCWLGKAERKLVARHVRGVLKLRGEAFLGKSLVAATCQTSPWNREKLLGVITYQQHTQARSISERLCGPAADPLAVNLFDTQRRRFILQEAGTC